MNNSTLRTATMFIVAAVLVAGTISMAVPASFAQAYYGQKEYKGYDDSYGKDYDKKKASEVNIQKVKCNNIIVNGIDVPSSSPGGMFDGTADENDGAWAEDGQWVGDGHKGSIGIDKNIVNICINKNNEIVVAEVPPIVPENCDDCFAPTNEGGPIPPGLLTMLNDYLADTPVEVGQAEPQIVNDVFGLCALIVAQNEAGTPATVAQITAILEDAFPGNSNPAVIERVNECLLGLGLIVVSDDGQEPAPAPAAQSNTTAQSNAQPTVQQQDQNTEESNPQLAAIQKLQQLKTQKLSDMIE